jgi:hypothetical protein
MTLVVRKSTAVKNRRVKADGMYESITRSHIISIQKAASICTDFLLLLEIINTSVS